MLTKFGCVGSRVSGVFGGLDAADDKELARDGASDPGESVRRRGERCTEDIDFEDDIRRDLGGARTCDEDDDVTEDGAAGTVVTRSL